MLPLLRSLTTNPVRVVTVVAAAIVAGASRLGIVVEQQSVIDVLLLIIPILLGGEIARSQVSPATGPIGPVSDDLLPPSPDSAL